MVSLVKDLTNRGNIKSKDRQTLPPSPDGSGSGGSGGTSFPSEPAHFVYAGPTSGADAAPTFRALVATDIPALDWSKITTGKPTTLAGYGITDAQPLDSDLTALAALTGTHNLYYRSGAGTWSSVSIGSGLSFTGGTLDTVGGGGSGDVVGPASATDNALVRFDTATGKLIQNSLATLSDSGDLSFGAAFISTAANPAMTISKTGGGPTNILVQTAGVDKATWGVSAGAGQGVAGSVAGDFFIKPVSGAVHLSVDDGTSVGFRLKATNVVQFPTYGAGVLVTDSSGNISASAGLGTGDVVGPASATDNAITRYDTTTGKLLQNSLAFVADDGGLTATYFVSNQPNNSNYSTFDWMTPSYHYTWALSGGSTGTPNLFYLYDQNAAAIRMQVNTSGDFRMFQNLAIDKDITSKTAIYAGDGSAGGSGLFVNSNTYAIIALARSGSYKASFGVANAGNDFMVGSVQDDFCIKSDASHSINFSTDAGATRALELVASTGNMVLTPPQSATVVRALQIFAANSSYAQYNIGKDSTHYLTAEWDSVANNGNFSTYNNAYPLRFRASSIDLETAGVTRATMDGDGNLFVKNTASPPSAPSGGGRLYVDSGALWYVGSSGTVTPIAPA